MQAEAESLEDVVLQDLVRAVEVGHRPGDPPRTMEASGGQASLGRPALESPPRTGCQWRQLAEPPGLELRIERPLALDLTAPRVDDALSHQGRRLASRLRRQCLDRHATHGDLEVDAVEQRA